MYFIDVLVKIFTDGMHFTVMQTWLIGGRRGAAVACLLVGWLLLAPFFVYYRFASVNSPRTRWSYHVLRVGIHSTTESNFVNTITGANAQGLTI
jgi:hypothetical protein